MFGHGSFYGSYIGSALFLVACLRPPVLYARPVLIFFFRISGSFSFPLLCPAIFLPHCGRRNFYTHLSTPSIGLDFRQTL